MPATLIARNGKHLYVLSALSLLHGCCLALRPQSSAKVATIGAGMGGSSAAYFLRQDLGNEVDIDVFEKEVVGGRTQIFRAGDRVIEMGASIVHEQNQYVRQFADQLGLKRVEPGGGSTESLLSIFDGRSLVFNQSAWSLLTLLRMVGRYGLSLFWFRSAPRSLLTRFAGVYESQGRGRAFDTPQALLAEIGLLNLTQHSMLQEVEGVIGTRPPAKRFAAEFIAGINHINYNQGNSRLNAMAGMVSMLPTIDSRLFAIQGGNFQIPVKLLQAARARLHQPVNIEKVERTADGSFLLHTEAGASFGPYAAVILAAPLESSGLSFKRLQLPEIPEREYQTTVTTIVRGGLRPSYFGVDAMPAGEYIMVSEGAGTPFSVIAPITPYENGTRLYKTFSSSKLDETQLDAIFGSAHDVVAVRAWKAYPRFNPPERFAPFRLADGLFYNNALENAASALEIAAIEGRNSALLVKRHLAKGGTQPRKPDRDTAELR